MNIGNGQLLGKRHVQQDYFASVELCEHTILVLADGVGGLVGGHVASEVAVKEFLATMKKMSLADPETALKTSLHRANRSIANVGKCNGSIRGMGTTLIALLIGPEKITWISVGDSLLYLWRRHSLSRLNKVHTRMVDLKEQVCAGLISQAEAEQDPQRDCITSALQGDDIPHIDCQSRLRSAEEGFLMASDGLSTLRSSELQSALRESNDAQRIVNKLMQQIEHADHQAQDNCTVLLFLPDQKNDIAKSSKYGSCLLLTGIVVLILVLSIAFHLNFKPDTDQVVSTGSRQTWTVTYLNLETQAKSKPDRKQQFDKPLEQDPERQLRISKDRL